MLLAHIRRLRARPRCHGGRSAKESRRHHNGQDGHDPVCLRRPVADGKPLERFTHAGRLQQRLGGRRGDGHVPGIAGHANRRLRAEACRLQRRRGSQANIWPYKPFRRLPRLLDPGHHGHLHKNGGGRSHYAHRNGRPRHKRRAYIAPGGAGLHSGHRVTEDAATYRRTADLLFRAMQRRGPQAYGCRSRKPA